MGNMLVWSDKGKGVKPEQVSEININEELFTSNDIVKDAVELEVEQAAYELQLEVLNKNKIATSDAGVVTELRDSKIQGGDYDNNITGDFAYVKQYSLSDTNLDDFFTSDEALSAQDDHDYSERELNDIMNPNGVSARRYAGGQMSFEGASFLSRERQGNHGENRFIAVLPARDSAYKKSAAPEGTADKA